MNKQIDKAKQVIEMPSKRRKLKFTQSKGEQIILSDALIEKTKKLLGINGYYTNLEETTVDNATILRLF